MLEHLVFPPTPFDTLRRVAPASGASAGLHLVALALVVRVALGGAVELVEPAPPERPVSFVAIADEDVRPDAPPPPPLADAAGAPVRAAPRYVPDAGKGPIAGDAPAGFQELRAPEEIKGIPDIDLSIPAVDTADFSGRGVIGGAGRGKPIEGPIAERASEVMRAGETPSPGSGSGIASRIADAGDVFDAAALDEPAALRDPDAVRRLLLSMYPDGLRQAGAGGQVLVEVVVDTLGHPEPATIRILESPHELFSDATRRAIPRMRFTPARTRYRDRVVRVRMRVIIPITWSVERQ